MIATIAQIMPTGTLYNIYAPGRKKAKKNKKKLLTLGVTCRILSSVVTNNTNLEDEMRRNLADAYCDYAEAQTVIRKRELAQEYKGRGFAAKYRGKDVVTGKKIKPGDIICRLGSGYTLIKNI